MKGKPMHKGHSASKAKRGESYGQAGKKKAKTPKPAYSNVSSKKSY